jgi:hypothetical protein
MENMRQLKIPFLYQKLESENISTVITWLFSHIWDDEIFEKNVLRWVFIQYPLELKKYIPTIIENRRWTILMELLFDISDYKILKNEFSRSFSLEKCRELQNYIVNIIIERLKDDYTLMNLGNVCSDCAVYLRRTQFNIFATYMGINTGDFRKIYITPLRAYIKVLQTNYENWIKVPTISLRRLCSKF